ncbi:MAG: hypothetical protein BJ554DRAFT_622, partial [Olpidium bornovanus]
MIAVSSGRAGPVLAASSAPRRGVVIPRRFLAVLLHVAAAAFVTGVLLMKSPRVERDCGLGDGALGTVGADGPSHWTRPGLLESAGPVQQPPQYRPRKKLMQQSVSSRITARPAARPPVPRLTWDAISTEQLREPDMRTYGTQRTPDDQNPAAPRGTSIKAAASPETANGSSDNAGVGDPVDDVEDARTCPHQAQSGREKVVTEKITRSAKRPQIAKLPNDIHHRTLLKGREHTKEDEKTDAAIFRLAKQNLIQDKYLILAVASNGNLVGRDFTKNWIATLRLTGHTSYLVMCLDELICASLDPAHSVLVPRHWLQGEIDTNPLLYGTAAYVNLVQSKTLVVIPFLKMGFTVLFSDVDIVWMSRGIIPYLEFMMRDNALREAIFSIEQVAVRTQRRAEGRAAEKLSEDRLPGQDSVPKRLGVLQGPAARDDGRQAAHGPRELHARVGDQKAAPEGSGRVVAWRALGAGRDKGTTRSAGG